MDKSGINQGYRIGLQDRDTPGLQDRAAG